MKLVSPLLELRVIRTICSTKSQKESSKLFASIGEDCFHTKAGKETYARIFTLMRERGELVGWGELKVDPVISENVREKLKVFAEKAIPSESVDKAIKVLHKYRRMRSMLELSQFIVKELNKKKVDIESLAEKAAKQMVDTKTGQNVDSWFIHVGAKDKSDVKAVKKLLEYDPKRFIPTGIKAFDDKSMGIPRGALLLVGGSTGSGKSVVTGQLAHNMARAGARVCIVPLEMKNEEMLQRELSRLTHIEMPRLNDPRTLSKMEKENIISRYERFRDKLQRVGATLSLFSPEEDMTAEEILFALKPFGYDVIFIDYIGLLKGVDGDDQWKAMRNVTRFCKRFAAINDMIIAVCAQLSDDGLIRYSKGMVEDSSNAFFFTSTPTTQETGVMWVDQPKSRRGEKFRFPTIMDFKHMEWRDLNDEEQGDLEQRQKEKKSKKGKDGPSKFGKAKPSKKESKSFDFDSEE
jgi:replicative DNA helicase